MKSSDTALTALCRAIRRDDEVEACRILTENPSLASMAENGRLPLIKLAASRGLCQLLTLMLRYGADVDVDPTNEGITALHVATFYVHNAAVKLLIDGGAQIDTQDYTGFTPLHCAAVRGDAVTIAMIADCVDDIDPVAHDGGDTPLIVAARCNNASAMAELLRRGADPAIANHDGETALVCAECFGSPELVQMISRALKGRLPEDAP